MPDDDLIIVDEDLLDDETYDTLPLGDIQRFGAGAQAGQEGCGSLCET